MKTRTKTVALVCGAVVLLAACSRTRLDPFEEPQAGLGSAGNPAVGDTPAATAAAGSGVAGSAEETGRNEAGGGGADVPEPRKEAPEVVPETTVAVPPEPEALQCGGDRCSGFGTPQPGGIFGECCTSNGECGVALQTADVTAPIFGGCIPRAQPGVADATCPGSDGFRIGAKDLLLNVPFAGCCKPSGQCGLSGPLLALGGVECVERSYFGELFAIEDMESIRCGEADLEADAGTAP